MSRDEASRTTYVATITRDEVDRLVATYQSEIEQLQDEIDEVNTRPSLGHPEASLGASWPSDRFADRARGIAGRNVASHGEWTRLRFNATTRITLSA